MPKHHSTQHRQQSEEKTRNKLLAETKRENHQLKRQVSRLQKTIQKILEQSVASTDPEEAAAQWKEPAFFCPSCNGGILVSLNLPFGSMLVCRDCGYRGKK